MQYSRCKCGELQVWHSGEAMATCSPCEKCGTVPGYGPSDHPPVTDHEWVETHVQTDEGKKTLTVCRMCHKTKAEIEQQKG